MPSNPSQNQDTVVLDEQYDPNYEPTIDEIKDYSEFLGMDVTEDKELLWIAKEGLKAPLPPGWRPCQTKKGDIYYFNFRTGESEWNHPCDKHYKDLYQREKTKKYQKDRRINSNSRKPKEVRKSAQSLFYSTKLQNPKSSDFAPAAPAATSAEKRENKPKTRRNKNVKTHQMKNRLDKEESKHRSAIDILKEKHQKSLQSLQMRQSKDLESMKGLWDAAMKKRRALHEKKLEEENKLHEIDIEEVRSAHQKRLQEKTALYEKKCMEEFRPQISQAETELKSIQKQIVEARKEMKIATEKLTESRDEQERINQSVLRGDEKIEQARVNADKAVAEIQKHENERIEGLRKESEGKIQMVKIEAENKIKSILDQVTEHEKELEACNKSLKSCKQDVDEHGKILKDLEERIRQSNQSLYENQKRLLMDKMRLDASRKKLREEKKSLELERSTAILNEKKKWELTEASLKARLLEAEALALRNKRSIFKLEEENSQLKTLENQKELELKKMMTLMETKTREATSYRQVIERAEEEKQSTLEQFQEVKGALADARRRIKSMQQKLKQVAREKEKKIAKRNNKVSSMQDKIEALGKECESLAKEVKSLNNERALRLEAERNKEVLEQRLRIVQERYEQTKTQLETNSSQASDLQNTIQRMMKEHKRTEERDAQQATSLAELKAEFESKVGNLTNELREANENCKRYKLAVNEAENDRDLKVEALQEEVNKLQQILALHKQATGKGQQQMDMKLMDDNDSNEKLPPSANRKDDGDKDDIPTAVSPKITYGSRNCTKSHENGDHENQHRPKEDSGKEHIDSKGSLMERMTSCVRNQKKLLKELQRDLRNSQEQWKLNRQCYYNKAAERRKQAANDAKEDGGARMPENTDDHDDDKCSGNRLQQVLHSELKMKKNELDGDALSLNNDVKLLKEITRWLETETTCEFMVDDANKNHPDLFSKNIQQQSAISYIDSMMEMIKRWAMTRPSRRSQFSGRFNELNEVKEWCLRDSKSGSLGINKENSKNVRNSREFVIRLKLDS
eukprot:jgi/Bigna1/89033/estExt_fgenesh1_pg.C_420129